MFDNLLALAIAFSDKCMPKLMQANSAGDKKHARNHTCLINIKTKVSLLRPLLKHLSSENKIL